MSWTFSFPGLKAENKGKKYLIFETWSPQKLHTKCLNYNSYIGKI